MTSALEPRQGGWQGPRLPAATSGLGARRAITQAILQGPGEPFARQSYTDLAEALNLPN
jgi:hypothetical protein